MSYLSSVELIPRRIQIGTYARLYLTRYVYLNVEPEFLHGCNFPSAITFSLTHDVNPKEITAEEEDEGGGEGEEGLVVVSHPAAISNVGGNSRKGKFEASMPLFLQRRQEQISD